MLHSVPINQSISQSIRFEKHVKDRVAATITTTTPHVRDLIRDPCSAAAASTRLD